VCSNQNRNQQACNGNTRERKRILTGGYLILSNTTFKVIALTFYRKQNQSTMNALTLLALLLLAPWATIESFTASLHRQVHTTTTGTCLFSSTAKEEKVTQEAKELHEAIEMKKEGDLVVAQVAPSVR
jgi:hypothetical protein